MRLTPRESDGIIQAIEPFLGKAKAELFLFGSRADDQGKGGDVDLLLIAEEPASASALGSQKHRILSEIKARIGDQKIDLKILDQGRAQRDPFVRSVFPRAVPLKRWG